MESVDSTISDDSSDTVDISISSVNPAPVPVVLHGFPFFGPYHAPTVQISDNKRAFPQLRVTRRAKSVIVALMIKAPTNRSAENLIIPGGT